METRLNIGDSVAGVIWPGYNWRINRIYTYKSRARASLVAIIGKEFKYHWSKGEYYEDKLAVCSDWIDNLKKI